MMVLPLKLLAGTEYGWRGEKLATLYNMKTREGVEIQFYSF
jgi:hypothetical protein